MPFSKVLVSESGIKIELYKNTFLFKSFRGYSNIHIQFLSVQSPVIPETQYLLQINLPLIFLSPHTNQNPRRLVGVVLIIVLINNRRQQDCQILCMG